MKISDSVLSALIASSITLIGLLFNIYLNRKNNKHIERRLRLEFNLEIAKERRNRLTDFLFHVKNFQYLLMDIIEVIQQQEYDENLNRLVHEQFKSHQKELRESWSKITMDLHDANMLKSMSLGQMMHDEVGQHGSLINITLNNGLSGNSYNNKENILILLTGYSKSLLKLMELIVEELRVDENSKK